MRRNKITKAMIAKTRKILILFGGDTFGSFNLFDRLAFLFFISKFYYCYVMSFYTDGFK